MNKAFTDVIDCVDLMEYDGRYHWRGLIKNRAYLYTHKNGWTLHWEQTAAESGWKLSDPSGQLSDLIMHPDYVNKKTDAEGTFFNMLFYFF